MSKILFSNPFPKKRSDRNLENLDLYLIRRIHPESGFYEFMIRFWICPKKTQNPFLDSEIRFWIRKSGFGFGFGNPDLDFPGKTHSNIHVSSSGVSKKSNCWLCRVLTTLTTEFALVSWKQVTWTCHVITERVRPIGLQSAGFSGAYSMLPSIRPLQFNIAITFLPKLQENWNLAQGQSQVLNMTKDSLIFLPSFPSRNLPTRVRNNSATLIDNIFVKNPEQVNISGNLISDVRDHFSHLPGGQCWKVVQYASRSLTDLEKWYSHIELEDLAGDFGCKKF